MAEAHCADYGFILRYPPEKENITHVAYEPWHFRYIGKENAAAVRALGITFEEYIEYPPRLHPGDEIAACSESFRRKARRISVRRSFPLFPIPDTSYTLFRRTKTQARKA